MSINNIALINVETITEFCGFYYELNKIYIDILSEEFLVLKFDKETTKENQNRKYEIYIALRCINKLDIVESLENSYKNYFIRTEYNFKKVDIVLT